MQLVLALAAVLDRALLVSTDLPLWDIGDPVPG